MPDAGTVPRKRKRPPYRRNDRHNHLDAAPHTQIDWEKLARDAAVQADRPRED
jgi:hypothetical protein